jgi:hemerythrin-like domain-containing protein
MTLVNLRKKDDPIVRDVEKGIDDEGLSPMAPPDAYAPPGDGLAVPYEEMHPLLRAYRDEHVAFEKPLAAFREALDNMREGGLDRDSDRAVREFFRCLDSEVLPHNRREEKQLFPSLSRHLLQSGEHSKGLVKTTAVDLLEEDHDQILQLAAITFNLFGLSSRLPDEASRKLVFDMALRQGVELAELLRLHIFREDHIVFSLAHQLMSGDELDGL